MQVATRTHVGAEVAAAINVLFDQSKFVSRDLHWQTDLQTGNVFE
jgi:hypothetical protein